MSKEIERKFVVTRTDFLSELAGERIVQGYVAKEPGAMTARVRIRAHDAYITLKGPCVGCARDEYEYPIPFSDAEEILAHYCRGRIVCKTRYLHQFHGHTYEIDVFTGRHAGLVIAEVELDAENEAFDRPDWIGEEVTFDARYGNYALALMDHSPEAKWWLADRDRGAANHTCGCHLKGRLSCCTHAKPAFPPVLLERVLAD
jgi:CYTH domain-containing protein